AYVLHPNPTGSLCRAGSDPWREHSLGLLAGVQRHGGQMDQGSAILPRLPGARVCSVPALVPAREPPGGEAPDELVGCPPLAAGAGVSSGGDVLCLRLARRRVLAAVAVGDRLAPGWLGGGALVVAVDRLPGFHDPPAPSGGDEPVAAVAERRHHHQHVR